MSQVRVEFHRLAKQEANKARSRYRPIRPELAVSFQQEVDAAAIRIAGNPSGWPVYKGPFHWVKTHRFPYILFYPIVEEMHVLVMAVAHTSRRAGYWNRRRPEN